MLIYAFALIPVALACGPAAGPTTDKPTLRFNFSYPLSWTFNTPAAGPGPGQAFSDTAAQNRVNADIEFAVIKALESYGYSTTGVTINDAAVKAGGPFLIADNGMCVVPTAEGVITYVQQDGVVLYECSPGTPGAPVVPTNAKAERNDNVAITITSPVALALSQWDNIATKVWANLANTAGVKFYGLIQVDTK